MYSKLLIKYIVPPCSLAKLNLFDLGIICNVALRLYLGGNLRGIGLVLIVLIPEVCDTGGAVEFHI